MHQPIPETADFRAALALAYDLSWENTLTDSEMVILTKIVDYTAVAVATYHCDDPWCLECGTIQKHWYSAFQALTRVDRQRVTNKLRERHLDLPYNMAARFTA